MNSAIVGNLTADFSFICSKDCKSPSAQGNGSFMSPQLHFSAISAFTFFTYFPICNDQNILRDHY